MARLTREDARCIATRYDIPLAADFHTLNSAQVQSIIDAADAYNYRAPRHANGSRARYFHAYLQRTAAKAVR